MVKIINYKQYESTAGRTFFSLILQGGISMVKSQETGMYYATSHNASVTSTFDEETCKSLIGQEIPGKVTKVSCEPYSYAIPSTGEIIELNTRWVYVPEEATEEQVIFEGKVETPVAENSF